MLDPQITLFLARPGNRGLGKGGGGRSQRGFARSHEGGCTSGPEDLGLRGASEARTVLTLLTLISTCLVLVYLSYLGSNLFIAAKSF